MTIQIVCRNYQLYPLETLVGYRYEKTGDEDLYDKVGIIVGYILKSNKHFPYIASNIVYRVKWIREADGENIVETVEQHEIIKIEYQS